MMDCHRKAWDDMSGTMSRLRAGRSGVRIPAGTKYASLFKAIRTRSEADWLPCFLLGVERPGRVVVQ
jgi:hypothetical protein